MQVTIQILLLLLNRTETATTGGLDTIFDAETSWDAQTILILSVMFSLCSSIKSQTSLTILEKGFCPTSSKLVALAWATFATLRRILSIVTAFIPSMGLFSLLNHWKWEQVPYTFRIENAEKISPGDNISLLGMKETIPWSRLDRWNYTDAQRPTPPSYSLYTLMTLQETFVALMILSILQFHAIFVVKLWKSHDFRMELRKTNMVIHTLENLNFASPYKDWADGDYSIKQFRIRAGAVRNEMIWTQVINFLVTMLMTVPLWYTGKEITRLSRTSPNKKKIPQASFQHIFIVLYTK